MKKINSALIGLLQALGVLVYCALVGGFFWFGDKFFQGGPGYFNVVLMLLLLVFSVAISGAIIFGFPVYLALNRKIKEALSVFAYTVLYCLGAFTAILIVLFILD